MQIEGQDAHQGCAVVLHKDVGEDRPRRREIQPNFWLCSRDFLAFPPATSRDRKESNRRRVVLRHCRNTPTKSFLTGMR